MQCLAILCLCLSLVWASPLQKGSAKKVFLKDIESRIINGQQATLGQIPYQVAIIATGFDGSWFCGGTLISDEWIVTAGHCVDGALFAEVYSGLVDLDGVVGTVSEAIDFILHEGYNPDILDHDIGLVRLLEALDLDEYTGIVTLATDPLDAGVGVQVSGWGLTSDGGTTVSSDLNVVDLVTISNSECDEYYGAGAIIDGIVCATSGDSQVRSTCSGDSGGPLIINPDTDPVHVGVVSFVSDEGCESGAPSGYTRTAPHRDWIRENTGV